MVYVHGHHVFPLLSAQNDAKEGHGVLQYKNGERYEGNWRANFANGA